MEKLSDRAKDRLKDVAERMENILKDIAYNAGMAAKTAATFVKGVLNGQRRP